MAKYNHNESLGKNAMRGVDITEPDLPTEVDLPSGVKLPDEFYDSVYEYLQDKYGRDVNKYAEAYGIEIKVVDISWSDL